jgi:hypothetical protein
MRLLSYDYYESKGEMAVLCDYPNRNVRSLFQSIQEFNDLFNTLWCPVNINLMSSAIDPYKFRTFNRIVNKLFIPTIRKFARGVTLQEQRNF